MSAASVRLPLGLRVGAVLLLLSGGAGEAWAQPARAARLEIAASAGAWGGAGLGAATPALTGPQVPAGASVPYFVADAAIGSGRAAEVRVGWRVWRRVFAEATGGVGWQRLHVDITRDIEQAAAAGASAGLTQFAVEGGLGVEIPRLSLWGDRLVPFAAGGGGYLRQLYEDRILVETGRTAYVGGGLKWRRRAGGRSQPRLVDRVGARGDVRVVWRHGGADLVDAWRPTLAVTGGVLLQF